jgi:hypothetical protein
MTISLAELRTFARGASTSPFIIRLSDGRSIVVGHPEFIGVPQQGGSFVIFPQEGGVQLLALGQVVSVEDAPASIKNEKTNP